MTKRTKIIGGSVIALVIVVLAVMVSIVRPKTEADIAIPLPFGFDDASSSLVGSITPIGVKNGITVKKVLFPEGTDAEVLSMDSVYLVTVPDDDLVDDMPLDQAFTLSGSALVNYFGYKYSSVTALAEKANKSSSIFTEKFPGQFFVSAKARAEDAQHGNAIATFEANNSITMAATDTLTGALLSRNSLYFLIVNEASGATLTVRTPAMCGDGDIEGAEICDKGDAPFADNCTNQCMMAYANPALLVDQVSLGQTSLVQGQQNVTIFKFTANPKENLQLMRFYLNIRNTYSDNSLHAFTGALENMKVFADADGDGVAETELHSEQHASVFKVQFDRIDLLADGSTAFNLQKNQSMTYELHADVSNTATGTLSIQFDDQILPHTVDALWTEPTGQRSFLLTSLKLNDLPCVNMVDGWKNCDMIVTTVASSPWTIQSPSPVCGNGTKEGSETCDDTNTTNGDGCSSVCAVESGYSCTGEPSVCTLDPVCGNGDIEAGETCDDSNTAADDGCSSVCAIEGNFSCTGTPSVCTNLCGNNICAADETAEHVPGHVGAPYYCPQDCNVCGDGIIYGSETCDDDNTANGDGCSDACVKEADFRCTGEPSSCISYLDFVKNLADTNHDGTVSQNEALVVTLDVADAPNQPYNTVSKYDIDADGDVDNTDVAAILAQLDLLAP